jgi:hypothetical protein
LEQKNNLRDGPSPAVENWALKIMMDKARDRLKTIDEQLAKQNTPERNIARLKKQIEEAKIQDEQNRIDEEEVKMKIKAAQK